MALDLTAEANALLNCTDEPLPVLVTASHVTSYDGGIEDSLEIAEIEDPPDLQLEVSQLQSQSLDSIHKLVSEKCHVSQDFVDKVIAFHLGHLTLTVEDLTGYFGFLDKTLYLFAHHCRDFNDLTAGDQHALLLDNAPIYFHLHLSRYIHACNGLSQVKSFLGDSLPSDLLDCDKFLTVSFRYMSAAMRLFKDPIWLEDFQAKADTLKALELNIDAMSACILFHCDLHGKMKNYDDPDKIKTLYSNLLSEMSVRQGMSVDKLSGIMYRIRAMVQSFCHGSTVSLASYSYRETTKVSLSILPAPCYENDEELFWMERQLRLCQEESNTQLSKMSPDLKNETILSELVHTKCLTYLNCHHEFRQLNKEKKHYAQIFQNINSNLTKAKAFSLAFLDLCDAQDQISWLLGPSGSKLDKFGLQNPTPIMKNMQDWLNNFPFVKPYINVVLMVILWSTDLVAEDSISLKSHLAALRDRYEAYLVYKIKNHPNAKNCISLLLELLNHQ